MSPNLAYALIGTAIVFLIVMSIKWIADDPSYQQEPIPKDGIERLIWQAKHGNEWATLVLLIIEERDMLTDITLAHMALEATVDIDESSPEYDALDEAQRQYHNHIARTYNKEEC